MLTASALSLLRTASRKKDKKGKKAEETPSAEAPVPEAPATESVPETAE